MEWLPQHSEAPCSHSIFNDSLCLHCLPLHLHSMSDPVYLGRRMRLQEAEFRAILRNEPRCWATAGAFMEAPAVIAATLELAQEVMAAQHTHNPGECLSPAVSSLMSTTVHSTLAVHVGNPG